MKPLLILGIVLIVAGVALLALRGIPYTKEHRAEIGPLKLKADEERTLPIPPIASVAILAGGVVLVVLGMKK